MRKSVILLLTMAIALSCFAGCGKARIDQEATFGNLETYGEETTATESVPITEPEGLEFDLAMINATDLNVRSGPGESHNVIRKLGDGAVVRIYERQDAEGKSWGKLADGWICLDYVRWYDEGVTVEDAELESKLIGQWHTEEKDYRIWTFQSDGKFTYEEVTPVYPNELMENNDDWKSGQFHVENGKLHLKVVSGTDPRPLDICGNSCASGQTARVEVSVAGKSLTLRDRTAVHLVQGGREEVLDLARSGQQKDKDLKKKIVGSWYIHEYTSCYSIWTFKEDFSYTYSYYILDGTDENNYTESKENYLSGSYCVIDDVFYISIPAFDRTRSVHLGGKNLQPNITEEMPVTVSGNTMTLNRSDEVLTKGGLTEAKNHFWNTVMQGMRPTPGTELVGYWTLVHVVDYENRSIHYGGCVEFRADGTFEMNETYFGYSYTEEEGFQRIPGMESGSAGTSGTYAVCGDWLILNATYAEWNHEDLGTTITDLQKNGDTIILDPDNNNRGDVTAYKMTFEELGPYLFKTES